MALRFLLFVLLSLAVPGGPALAQSSAKPEQESPAEMLEDATRTILKAFELMLRAIPQYEAPEILENGDIIIRRKRPEKEKPAPGGGKTEKTKI
ncbi:MAG: hypothetical protein IIB14_00630 [Chloroflexi bacterium]|nr:hypothetical protein [Chloroflexota bacterium]